MWGRAKGLDGGRGSSAAGLRVRGFGVFTVMLVGKGHYMPRIVDLLRGLLVAQADGQGESGGLANLLVNLFPFIMIAVLFYLLMIRPERRKKAELNEMLENLKKNDRIVTIGGIHGTVVSTSKGSEEVSIKVDDSTNTKLKLQRSAIARVLTDSGGSSGKEGS